MAVTCQILSPVGYLQLEENGQAITRIAFVETKLEHETAPTPLLAAAAEQLEAYFAGRLDRFDLPVALSGTPFQGKVWQALRQIPYGETRTYQEIAAAVGNPAACRAVGMANHHNPLAIVVPCHRVIGKNGALTGYAGGLDRKRFLLDLERRRRSLR